MKGRTIRDAFPGAGIARWCLAAWLAIGLATAVRAAEADFALDLQPVPERAFFKDPGHIVWCGAMTRGDDGKYHLYYSRWPRELGHYAWVTHSEIAHAVADDPLGPYRFAGVAVGRRGAERWDGLCAHNPTVLRSGGKYYLYYMGNTGDGVAKRKLNWSHRNNQRIGVAVADSPDGPWRRSDVPLLEPTAGFHDALCMANPSVAPRPEGGFLMVYKAVADLGKMPFGGPVTHVVATAEHPEGPFTKHPGTAFTAPGEAFAAEDPFIWRGPDRYWAIVKDMKGRFTGLAPSLALFESADGFAWKLARRPLVSGMELRREEGPPLRLMKLERPQIWFDRGEPAVLLCAGAPAGRLNESFNVQIPLRRSR